MLWTVFSVVVAILKWVLIIVVVLGIAITLFVQLAPTFGSHDSVKDNPKILNSINFYGRIFVNLAHPPSTIDIPQSYHTEDDKYVSNMLFPPADKNPTQPLKTEKLQLTDNPLQAGEFVWLGHSTVFFRLADKTMITDPVFHRASPIPIGGKPFAMSNTPSVAGLPYIDMVLISHDHYDHLDHLAIQQMKDKVGHFYVPLGVARHLRRWGVADDKISEYDWYEDVKIDDITLTFVPAQHFSGRGIFNHRTTLWGGWAVQSPELKVYFSGDTGYTDEFAKIGERLGGFDIAFIEDGAYNTYWRNLHMMPEESAQAGIDVGAKVVLPIHWGKFDLAAHEWEEPVERLTTAINQHNASLPTEAQIRIATPKIGQVFDLDNIPQEAWWLESK